MAETADRVMETGLADNKRNKHLQVLAMWSIYTYYLE